MQHNIHQNNRMQKFILGTLVASLLGLSACSTHQSISVSSQSSSMPVKAEYLAAGHWDAFNREQLNQLIKTYGKDSPNYNPQKRPYMVTDFDNTSVFLDIEEATLIYQLEHLAFKVTPAQLNQIIRKGINNQNFVAEYNNQQGQSVNIDKIAPDIISSYTWLYQNYQGLNGKKSLVDIQKDPHYLDFVTKMRYLYAAIGDTFDHEVAYPWVTYLFTGMTESQVRDLVKATFAWQQQQPIGPVKWISPASLAGKAGVVSIEWENGLHPYQDMQNLFKTLQDNGIDVYVCSASFIDVIKEIISNPDMGYNIDASHAYAMELERDVQGKILPEFRHGYAQTQGKGKTQTIQRFLVSKYGYGPILIAGDSEGDQNMMQDFSDTKKVIIVNRLRKPSTDIGKFSQLAVQSYGKTDAKFLLQGRDANTGLFTGSIKSLSFGSTTAKTLKGE
ncbi:haloacid dehalogenase-like hydrolase [Acinetobacter sp. MD2]|uniref:haloacid dehalogenase-like hydrolase n=1 Tax=Acinetobacter sp. MD2 TaxID=2600066 RepID=UPI002D1F1171|nr:haloacid dehalogenase-like hydrolase [Acinetobacter sp. MD2]MEB3767645.1 haloacid dehalogenase-like hydrolase [Acinetobacter sp. MD2]